MQKINRSFGLLEEINKDFERSIVWYTQANTIKNQIYEPISLLGLTLLRDNDFILLPVSPYTIKSWEWSQKEFQYSDNQVKWYNYYNKNEESEEFHRKIFQQFQGKNIIFVGYIVDKLMLNAAKDLGLNFYGDCFEDLPDKRWIHPTIPEGSIHTNNTHNFDLPLVNSPAGYTVYNKAELKRARELLIEQGISDVIIKNANGVGGLGIYYCNSDSDFEKILSEIEFKNGLIERISCNTQPAYLIEKRIELFVEKENDQLTSTPVAYFFGKKFLKICKQLVKNNCFNGTIN